ncbi:MAG: bifunctional hydroxymethylpyrimidine kinase/phosphomethylpyrimidine kinase, partial [Syntrophaceae bacterium]|nr:bifunctional hydroxymethylpyrimidine kinase/phosphomethylpyrimidine kinase [Syntrophaceae bacterium]
DDPSGNVGVQGDIKTFNEIGVEGLSIIAVESPLRRPVPADLLSQKISTIVANHKIAALKIGMLGTAENVRVVAWFLAKKTFDWIVIDPILHSSGGAELLENHAIPILKSKVLIKATLITPNLDEASTLAGMRVFNVETMKTAAKEIFENTRKLAGGVAPLRGVLVKGGSLKGDAVDILFDGEEHHVFRSPRYVLKLTHGMGCILSAAITAYLAKGETLLDAIDQAKAYLVQKISKTEK